MGRPITLVTGQWADMPLEVLAEKASGWGYDGLELCCWGDHFDVHKAAESKEYCQGRHDLLAKHSLKVWSLSNHLAGQLVLDPNDHRTDDWAPKACRGKPEKKREWAIEEMKLTALAAKNMGLKVVNGFTGSSIWHYLYSFPPVSPAEIEAGFKLLAELWGPILDVFKQCRVRFALEVHPTEIAFDIVTAERAIKALGGRKEFGFNFDPSHLHWQGVDPVKFLYEFKDRIYHMHVKDAIVTLDGRSGILASHLNFGDPRRGWDFRSPGRGGIDFEEIIRALNNVGYSGPLSVEWEDSGMDREHGAQEACEFVRQLDFAPSGRAFDAAFSEP
ncbi:MAG: sugar phosphate isomerase/epimerase [Armatimonadetes bacterium]|nr:sugar phosphate isomerase/epimerase [Armatimonadota bacterium]